MPLFYVARQTARAPQRDQLSRRQHWPFENDAVQRGQQRRGHENQRGLRRVSRQSVSVQFERAASQKAASLAGPRRGNELDASEQPKVRRHTHGEFRLGKASG